MQGSYVQAIFQNLAGHKKFLNVVFTSSNMPGDTDMRYNLKNELLYSNIKSYIKKIYRAPSFKQALDDFDDPMFGC